MSVEIEYNPPAEPSDLQLWLAGTGLPFPEDYLEFMKVSNGCDGFCGDHAIILWKCEELAQFNKEYEVAKYAPGVFLIGSTGGGEGYGFDFNASPPPVVLLPFIGMERKYATVISSCFSDLFSTLERDDT